MQWYEILLIVLACAFVLGVIVWQIIRKKQGKSSCDCGGNCSACCGCSYAKKEDKK